MESLMQNPSKTHGTPPWRAYQNSWNTYGKPILKSWKPYGKPMENPWKTHRIPRKPIKKQWKTYANWKPSQSSWKSYGKLAENPFQTHGNPDFENVRIIGMQPSFPAITGPLVPEEKPEALEWKGDVLVRV